MAVDATHPNQAVPFSWPSFQDFVVPQMRFSGNIPSVKYPVYQTPALCGSINTVDSGLTYNFPAAVPRKRARDSMNQFYVPSNFPASQKCNGIESQFSSIFGDVLLPQIQQHQLEIDTIISQHTKKMRLELEERQKQQTKLLAAAIEEGAIRKLKEKEDQIQKMEKLNLALQERVKCIFMENQLWRDLAQTNEAQANSLRSDLELVLAHAESQNRAAVAVEPDDVESCCGSNDANVEGGGSDRMCKGCGERESCVLLLPCRHLCLCSVCGSGSYRIQACPVCNSTMNATLHVYLSP